jgi:hypothetical protein
LFREELAVVRIEAVARPESEYAADELAGFEMLRWGVRSGTPDGDAPELGTRTDAQEGIQQAIPAPLYRTAMSAAGLSALTVSLLKMQVRGEVLTRHAHEWVDQGLGWDFYDPDTDSYPLLGGHTPIAVRVGVSIPIIEAVRDGRLDDMPENHRHHYRFVQQIREGTVDDAAWKRNLELMPHERGSVEEASATLLLLSYILAAHAFQISPSGHVSREDLELGIQEMKNRNRELGNIEAYEARVPGRPWPCLESGFEKKHVHWFDRTVPGNLGIVDFYPSRATTDIAEHRFGEDDLSALELLNEYDLFEGPEPRISAWKLIAGLSPMCALALEMWTVGGMKAQARGKIARGLRAWNGLVLSFDSTNGDWFLLREYVPIALASDVRPDAIKALSETRLDDLTADERATVDFIRALFTRTVTDDIWQRQLDVSGSEDELLEQMMDIFLQWKRIRYAQMLDLGVRTSKSELDAMLSDPQPVDMDAYEATFEAIPWEKLSCYDALLERSNRATGAGVIGGGMVSLANRRGQGG